jgi:hypothetical protein
MAENQKFIHFCRIIGYDQEIARNLDFCVERLMSEKARNEMAVKPLKTNNSTKSLIRCS